MRKTWAGKLLAMVLTGVTVMGTMPAYAVFAEEAQQLIHMHGPSLPVQRFRMRSQKNMVPQTW